MLRTKVKASSITNLTDARYFASKGVNWLGFNLDSGNENYIQPALMNEIGEWIEGVEPLVEYGKANPETINKSIATLLPQHIQIGASMKMEDIFDLHPSILIHKEIIIKKEMDKEALEEALETYNDVVATFSLNFNQNGILWEHLVKNEPFSIAFLEKISKTYPIILEMNFAPDMLQECLDTLPLYGITLSGGMEERVGFKSYEELDELFDILQEEP